ncbi:hypothetical protein LR48_Vigan01g035400 [Vigna angularis]|uniref:Uncharacterized protein n=1 Tax=Phaseolus angularis TaxID=3914 RepID=A0A0L9TKW2_PHAAN|nr:hypothetical protein LR48_Vigan01g035400 [Vigna angularis]
MSECWDVLEDLIDEHESEGRDYKWVVGAATVGEVWYKSEIDSFHCGIMVYYVDSGVTIMVIIRSMIEVQGSEVEDRVIQYD